MSKKQVVIEELEDFKIKKCDTGLYSIMPYKRLNKGGNAIFKVGQFQNFNKRMEQYHTSYPLCFYYKNLLVNPKTERKVNRKPLTEGVYINKVEKFLQEDLIAKGARQLHTTTRVKNAKNHPENLGTTEWFYSNQKQMDSEFKDAHNKFGGSLHSPHFKIINTNARRNAIGADYKAEIYYKVR